MAKQKTSSNRRGTTLVAGTIAAGALLMAGPAATAFAAPGDPVTSPNPPDYSIGGFLNNAGQFAGALGTNTEQFLGTLGNNGSNFVGTLGTNALIFAGTLGNNLVGNPPNTGGKPTTTPASLRVAPMNVSNQCNASGSGSCTR